MQSRHNFNCSPTTPPPQPPLRSPAASLNHQCCRLTDPLQLRPPRNLITPTSVIISLGSHTQKLCGGRLHSNNITVLMTRWGQWRFIKLWRKGGKVGLRQQDVLFTRQVPALGRVESKRRRIGSSSLQNTPSQWLADRFTFTPLHWK